MNGLCKYKDILGKPSEGFHSIKLFDIAVLDVLGTIFLAYTMSITFNYSFIILFLLFMIIGELLHFVFCVKTTVINYITNFDPLQTKNVKQQ